jgi:hypothetical protein
MKIDGKEIGFGNKYKTINPLVLLARQVAKHFYDPKDIFADGPDMDYEIYSPIGFSVHYHLIGFPVHEEYKGSETVNKIYKYFKAARDWKRKQYYRFKKQHHKLTILNIEPTSWTDVDTRMLHACFTLLGSFVEDELGKISLEYKKKYPDCDYKGYRLHSCGGHDEKAIDLWLWYKEELPKEKKAYEEYLDKKYCNMKMVKGEGTFSFQGVARDVEGQEKYEPEDKKHLGYDYIEALQDKKLMELIELRRTLWT